MPTMSATRLPRAAPTGIDSVTAVSLLGFVVEDRTDAAFEDVNGPVLRFVLTLGTSAATTVASLLLGLEMMSMLVWLLTGAAAYAASSVVLHHRARELAASTRESFLTDALRETFGSQNADLLCELERIAQSEDLLGQDAAHGRSTTVAREWRWWLGQRPAQEREALLVLVEDARTNGTVLTTREVLELAEAI